MSAHQLGRGPSANPLSDLGVELRCVDGGHYKFYILENVGRVLLTRWGRIGTFGQSSRLEFLAAASARTDKWQTVAEKIRKGYRMVAPAGGGLFAPDVARLEAEEIDHPTGPSLHALMNHMERTQRQREQQRAETVDAVLRPRPPILRGGVLSPDVVAELRKPMSQWSRGKAEKQLENLAPRRRITFGRKP